MERVLFIMGNMGLGGAETHIMKIYRYINKEDYQFDFVLNVQEKCYYEDEIYALGGNTYRVTPKAKNVLRNYREIKRIVKEKGYKIVFKCGEQAMSWTEMLAAKQGGARIRIMRSTNSKGSPSKLNNIMHALSRVPLCWLTTNKVAPSKVAGEWLFGKRACKNLLLVNNGVDIEHYAYSEDNRISAREEFGIPYDGIVVGHVGRFNDQKNHTFLIDIFSEYHNKHPQSYLLLVGEGPLKESIEEKVQKLGLEQCVYFVGNRHDVNKLYSAMDLFVFPSFFEGMPNTVIEAQANGLKCYIADTITREANITDNVTYLPLGNPGEWVDQMENRSIQHLEAKHYFHAAGYDIDSVTKVYVSIFDELKRSVE